MTTVSTLLPCEESSSSAVRTTARCPDFQSGPARIFCIRVWNQESATDSAQSWASLHRSGTTMPMVGNAPAVMSPASWVSGTFDVAHRDVSDAGVKYAHGLCLTTYLPVLDFMQFEVIPSAYTLAVFPAVKAWPNTEEPLSGCDDGAASS